jgi:hypothetical protein
VEVRRLGGEAAPGVLVEEVEVNEEELEPVAVPVAVPEPLPVAVKLAVALGLPVREPVFDVVDDVVTSLLFEATAVPLDVADGVTERVPVADPLSVAALDPVGADEPEGEAVVELVAVGLEDLTDTYVEAYQGKYGIIENYPDEYTPPMQPLQYLVGLSGYVTEMRPQLATDSELQNIIDEIAALIDSTIYKLRFLK